MPRQSRKEFSTKAKPAAKSAAAAPAPDQGTAEQPPAPPTLDKARALRFVLAILAAWLFGYYAVTVQMNKQPAPAPITKSKPAPCTDLNRFYTCQSARDHQDVQVVLNMMGAR